MPDTMTKPVKYEVTLAYCPTALIPAVMQMAERRATLDAEKQALARGIKLGDPTFDWSTIELDRMHLQATWEIAA